MCLALNMEGAKFIKCNYCNRKSIHDDDHIKTNFGYKRNGEYYKTCLNCRDRNTGGRENT